MLRVASAASITANTVLSTFEKESALASLQALGTDSSRHLKLKLALLLRVIAGQYSLRLLCKHMLQTAVGQLAGERGVLGSVRSLASYYYNVIPHEYSAP